MLLMLSDISPLDVVIDLNKRKLHKRMQSTITNTYERLESLYRSSGYEPGALQKDLEHYFRIGYVFSTPEYFIMGCAISSGWYVHAAVGAGAIEGFLQFMPYHLPYVGWERRGSGKVKWYPTDKLKKKLIYEKSKISASTDTTATAK